VVCLGLVAYRVIEKWKNRGQLKKKKKKKIPKNGE